MTRKTLPGWVCLPLTLLLGGMGCAAELVNLAKLDLQCPETELKVITIDENTRSVTGCGKQATYQRLCTGADPLDRATYFEAVDGFGQPIFTAAGRDAGWGKLHCRWTLDRSTCASGDPLCKARALSGDRDSAIEAGERALAIREKAVGQRHPDLVPDLHSLAELHKEKGDHARAESLLLRALAIHEDALGPDHPQVASDLGNLASLYRAKGDSARMESLLLRVLAIHEKTLGPDHRRVASDLNELAKVYQAKGEHERAEPLLQRALAIQENALGPNDRAIVATLNNLAETCRAKGDHGRAELLLRRALDIQGKAPGGVEPVKTLGNPR